MVDPLLASFTWSNPTRVIFGAGQLSALTTIIGELAGNKARVFLVTGRRNLRAQGVVERVVNSIGATRLTLFDQVTPFPSPQLVVTALVLQRRITKYVVLPFVFGCQRAITVGSSHHVVRFKSFSKIALLEEPSL